MTESIENPLGLPRPRSPFARWGSAGGGASVEDQIGKIADRGGFYKTIIFSKVGPRSTEDVWQNALLQMTQHLQAGNEVKNLHAYMKTVCVNAANAELRRRYLRSEVLVGDAYDVKIHDTEEDLVLDETGLRYSDVRTILAKELTALEHQVYLLRYGYEMTSTEIGEQLGCKASAVRQTLTRANNKLTTPSAQAFFREVLADS